MCFALAGQKTGAFKEERDVFVKKLEDLKLKCHGEPPHVLLSCLSSLNTHTHTSPIVNTYTLSTKNTELQ